MRILGIDYGTKRIGLAVSDPLGITSQGLQTLEHKGEKNVLEGLKKVCQEYGVDEIVIGFPVNMDGSQGPKAKEVTELVPKIEAATGKPVKTWDERLTSRQVGRLMIEEGLSRRKQKSHSDQLSAILILQGYLDSRRTQFNP